MQENKTGFNCETGEGYIDTSDHINKTKENYIENNKYRYSNQVVKTTENNEKKEVEN